MCTSIFTWNVKKNIKLRKDRGIDFETIIERIEKGDFKIFQNQSSAHNSQKIFIIKNRPYPFVVPFREEPSGDIFLITVFQSRKFKNIFSED